MHFEIIAVARKLAGGFVKLLLKIPWFILDYSGFFEFHDFSMHGIFFLVIFQDIHDFQSL